MLDGADHRLRCIEIIVGQYGGGTPEQIVNAAAVYAAFVLHEEVPALPPIKQESAA